MLTTLRAGVARKIINPPLGIKRPGIRLFADPIQAIESDLTATALVLSNGDSKVIIVACDLVFAPMSITQEVRRRIGDTIGTPTSHVMINFSHTHSGPAFPEFIDDTPEQLYLQHTYQKKFVTWLVELAAEANQRLQEVRIGAGWGEAHIGVYRRETGPDGRDVLGEVPGAAIDPAVGVIRVDDLEGQAMATLFSYGCHTVTMGPRSMMASSDFPGPARDLIENTVGGLALFLQACGGNVNPIHGIGYEVDGRDTKNRTGQILGGEVVKVAAGIRTNVRAGERRPLGTIPNILFRPWLPVEDEGPPRLAAVEETVQLQFVDLPSLTEAEAIHQEWQQKLAAARANDARDWEISVAKRFTDWSAKLVEAVRAGNPPLELVIQAIRINDVVLTGINIEAFFETGLAIKAQSPFEHTQVLGYTNGCVGYLPRAEDYPPEGWKFTERYAVPDLFFQSYSLPGAFRPESEQLVIQQVSKLIQQLV